MPTSPLQRTIADPRLRGLRRWLNSSPLLPGPVRKAIGGRVYSSADYRVLAAADASELAALDGWLRRRVARRQLRSWQRRLASGEAAQRPDVANLRAAVAQAAAGLGVEGPTVLETGCGGAYNRRLLVGVLPRARYFGSDVALPMLTAAEPSARGCLVQAATEALPLRADAIDIVVDGVALIHIPRWREAVAEMCRVARAAVVLHTVTVTTGAPTTLLAKRAYGYPVPEWVFDPADLRAALADGGFEVAQTWDGIAYDLNDVVGIETASQTWLALPRP